ncbi:CD209 antigen-like protein C [Oryzias melastigma]|uniref:CD209 antigen-like protein C n=1 Tax=Oryzias melastigma TaxID=30732 RepID=UPI00168CF9D2|nr:CD209 antigen-like protein C [Oryzias melastigma]
MSSDIYAQPDLSKKVRYDRKQQEDSSDWDECEVKIYNEAYESVEYTTKDQSPEQVPQTEPCPEVQKRCCRCEKWCLLVLCTVLLAVLIILSSSYMAVNISNLQKKVQEQKLLSEGINNTLLYELKQLKNKIERKLCPDLWVRFRTSCYYKSIEKKTWTDSRRFCQDKEADLLVINSKEEQEFVSKMNPNKDFWIGLYAEGSSYKSEWKWVDGSPLTETFWEENFPKDPNYSYNAVCLSDEGKWTQHYQTSNRNWICEK